MAYGQASCFPADTVVMSHGIFMARVWFVATWRGDGGKDVLTYALMAVPDVHLPTHHSSKLSQLRVQSATRNLFGSRNKLPAAPRGLCNAVWVPHGGR